jgi:hypothetical protein
MTVRPAIVAVVVLMIWSQTAPLGAVEAIRLPASCSYVANKVMLAPSPIDHLLTIVSEREHKTIRGCSPGLAGKCRSWEVHRFELMCGGRQVSWRLVAGQLVNLASSPERPERRDALFRTHLEPWEVRSLLAEPEFAPVDELGGRILLLADNALPQQRVISRDSAGAKAAPDSLPSGPPRLDQDSAVQKVDAPKAAPSYQSEAPLQQTTSGALSLPSGVSSSGSAEPGPQSDRTHIAALTPSREKADVARPADAATLPQVDGSKREGDSASNLVAVAAAETADAPPAVDTVAQPHNGFASSVPIVLGFALVVIIIALMIFGAVMWWRSAAFRHHASHRGIVRVVYEDEADQDPEALAAACRELMKEVGGELVKAMTAVNSLRGVPALQTALHAELESVRRSLGFTPQIRGASGEKKDWKQIRSQLTQSLQGTQRIIGIAEAARTSFAVHPAALEVVTTRLEAYAFLGVNASASEMVVKKAVNALRECWHPDLATSEEDRRLREVRIKQINVAWDLITGKQMSY